ncbi:MAG: SCP2 sterol-binding domain-containing protein [Candidatus Thermoplasmatota archaeon]|nr:SCP2 sterol-binding domain-containing protein [Candidatus Thermoplasmatota archaeon]
MTDLEHLFRAAINKFNERVKADDKLKEVLRGLTRKVVVELEEEKRYSFVIQNSEIINFSSCDLEQPDIQIISDSETLGKLLNKELSPFKAYATGRVKIKASPADLILLRRFLKAE